MLRSLLAGKIHRATVTHADLHYVGSLTVDGELMAAAGMVANERVLVVDIDNGARLETYLIEGEPGSGVLGVNGAAAHLIHPGDTVIVMSFGLVDDAEQTRHQPRVVHVDGDNRIIAVGTRAEEAIAEGLSTPPFARTQSDD